MPLFLVRSIPHMKAKATPMKSMKDISGLPPKNEKPICTPISSCCRGSVKPRAASGCMPSMLMKMLSTN